MEAFASDPGKARALFDRDIVPLVLQARGRELIHASAVLVNGGVIGFCADSGTGKTTLALAMNAPFWADDALVILADGTSEHLPATPHLRAETAARFPAPALLPAPLPAPVLALYILERGARLEIQPVPAPLPELLRHAYCFSLQDSALKERTVRAWLDIASRVPVRRLQFRPGFEFLDEICRFVRSTCRG